MPGLPLLDDPKHPNPGFSLRDLAGERCGAGILPCHCSSPRPVHLDHVAGEGVIIDSVGHHHRLIVLR